MSAEQLLSAVADRDIEIEAAGVLEKQGITLPDAVRRLLAHVAQEKALPIELLSPTADTLAAMEEARAGQLPRFNSLQALLDDLHADD
jgi:DNA-damage-inducible protein J